MIEITDEFLKQCYIAPNWQEFHHKNFSGRHELYAIRKDGHVFRRGWIGENNREFLEFLRDTLIG